MANFIHQNSRGLEKADHRGRATPKGEVVRDEVRLTSWRLCGVREQLYHPVISLDTNPPTHPQMKSYRSYQLRKMLTVKRFHVKMVHSGSSGSCPG